MKKNVSNLHTTLAPEQLSMLYIRTSLRLLLSAKCKHSTNAVLLISIYKQ